MSSDNTQSDTDSSGSGRRNEDELADRDGSRSYTPPNMPAPVEENHIPLLTLFANEEHRNRERRRARRRARRNVQPSYLIRVRQFAIAYPDSSNNNNGENQIIQEISNAPNLQSDNVNTNEEEESDTTDSDDGSSLSISLFSFDDSTDEENDDDDDAELQDENEDDGPSTMSLVFFFVWI